MVLFPGKFSKLYSLYFIQHSHLVQLADEGEQVVHGCLLRLVVVLAVHHYPGHVVVRGVQRLSLRPHGVLEPVTLGALASYRIIKQYLEWLWAATL